MTWVIAQASPFGYITAVSDTCVTIYDEKTGEAIRRKDCLQKLYGLEGTNILIGFAGDIRNAFRLLDSLTLYARQFAMHPGNDRSMLDVEEILNFWVPVARKFHRYEGQERVELIIAAESLTKDNGLPGHGKGVVAELKSPDYIVSVKPVGQWASIGSGNEAEECIEILDNPEAPWHPLMKMEVGHKYGYGQALAMEISADLKDKLKTEGISKSLLIGISSREGITISPNDHTITHKDGHVEEFRVPPLCANYKGLEELLHRHTDNLAARIVGEARQATPPSTASNSNDV